MDADKQQVAALDDADLGTSEAVRVVGTVLDTFGVDTCDDAFGGAAPADPELASLRRPDQP